MEDYSQPPKRRNTRARQRQQKRQNRREAMVSLRDEGLSKVPTVTERLQSSASQIRESQIGSQLRDVIWYLLNRTPVLRIVMGGALILFIGLLISTVFSNQIGPNIWTMGQSLSGLTVEEARSELVALWQDEILIDLTVGGEIIASISPNIIGLNLDARTMAEDAKALGLTGFPMGASIDPVLQIDYGIAQNYLLTLTDTIYIPPYDAGYQWQDGRLIGVQGTSSRELDIALSLEQLTQNSTAIVTTQRFDLLTNSMPPNIVDPSPYLDEAYAFVNNDFTLMGYDPYTNEYIPWTASEEERTQWIAAGTNGIVLRESAFDAYYNALNEWLFQGEYPRYLQKQEIVDSINVAMQTGMSEALLRIRYLPTEYVVESQDNGFRIGRKTGLPFGLIDEANPGLDWNTLSIGQTINLPSRDTLLQTEVVSNKRIVVDLDRLWMVAYENGQVIFSWPISSGRDTAPTYPGIFQILQKDEIAYGSSYSLCSEGSNDCDQWEMYWFMGIYEVFPGLMNGFHGAVLLPNGAFLGGGGVRGRTTFGCVMSENSEAEQLFAWADVGTIVEIVSSEFQPESNIGLQAMDYITANSY